MVQHYKTPLKQTTRDITMSQVMNEGGLAKAYMKAARFAFKKAVSSTQMTNLAADHLALVEPLLEQGGFELNDATYKKALGVPKAVFKSLHMAHQHAFTKHVSMSNN